MSQFSTIEASFQAAKQEAIKFNNGTNKAAGTRYRKHLFDMITAAKAERKLVQELKGSA